MQTQHQEEAGRPGEGGLVRRSEEGADLLFW